MNITLRVGRLARRAITVTGAAALIAGLGLVAVAPGAVASDVSVAAPATTCDQLGYTKIDQESGDETLDFGTLTWDGTTLTYDINDGYAVDICLKGGNQDPGQFLGLTGTDTLEWPQDISHIGYVVSTVPGTTTTTEPGTTTTTTPGTTTTTTPGTTTTTTPGTTTTTPGTTTSTTPGTTTTTTPGTTTSTTPGTTTSTTPDTTTSTPGASVLPSVSPSVTPSVLASAVTSTPAVQPAALARTGVELWTVALLAGLFLLAGGAMIALGNGAPSGRRH
jgi:hypothetical protein